jgi:hypothetical protein
MGLGRRRAEHDGDREHEPGDRPRPIRMSGSPPKAK